MRFGGDDNGHITNELRSRYADAINAEKEKRHFENEYRRARDAIGFAEVSLEVEAGKAQEFADKINAHVAHLHAEIVPAEETEMYY